MVNRNCFIFDLDGTLADCSHRLHHIKQSPKDWRAFFAACPDDAPIPHMITLAKTVWAHHPVLFVSGRSDECLQETERWLEGAGFARIGGQSARWLYMRKAGDYRADDIVKGELLDKIIADGWNPVMAFDDRDRVVAMWRARGIPCAQVAPGDF